MRKFFFDCSTCHLNVRHSYPSHRYCQCVKHDIYYKQITSYFGPQAVPNISSLYNEIHFHQMIPQSKRELPGDQPEKSASA